MTHLLGPDEAPVGFAYPSEFLRVVQLGLTNLEPWQVLEGDGLRNRHSGLAQRYPARSLVPFAARQDCDDVACWDLDASPGVVIVHDYASAGFELDSGVVDFNAWLRLAVEDFIEFGPT